MTPPTEAELVEWKKDAEDRMRVTYKEKDRILRLIAALRAERALSEQRRVLLTEYWSSVTACPTCGSCSVRCQPGCAMDAAIKAGP